MSKEEAKKISITKETSQLVRSFNQVRKPFAEAEDKLNAFVVRYRQFPLKVRTQIQTDLWRLLQNHRKDKYASLLMTLLNYTGYYLHNKNLSHINPSGADLSYMHLDHCDLSNACLKGAYMEGAAITQCTLDGTDLSNVDYGYFWKFSFPKPVTAMAVYDHYLVAGQENEVVLVDMHDAKFTIQLLDQHPPGYTVKIIAIGSISPSRKLIASASRLSNEHKYFVKLVDPQAKIDTEWVIESPSLALGFSFNNQFFSIASQNSISVKPIAQPLAPVYELENDPMQENLTFNPSLVKWPAVSIMGIAFSEIILYQPDTDSIYLRLLGHQKKVLKTAMSPDNRWLASTDEDGFVRIWERSTGLVQVLQYKAALLNKIAFRKKGDKLFLLLIDQRFEITRTIAWDMDKLQDKPVHLDFNINASSVFSADAQYQAFSSKKVVSVYETIKKFDIRLNYSYPQQVVAFGQNRWVCQESCPLDFETPRLSLFDDRSKPVCSNLDHELVEDEQTKIHISFDPSNQFLAAIAYPRWQDERNFDNSKDALWNATTGQRIYESKPDETSTQAIAFLKNRQRWRDERYKIAAVSPDGRLVVSTLVNDTSPRLEYANNLKTIRTLDIGYYGSVISSDFSSDGQSFILNSNSYEMAK